jgi:hypothetical protein
MSAPDWSRFREEKVKPLDLDADDADRLVALCKDAFGDDDAGMKEAENFLTAHNRALRAKPVEMLRSREGHKIDRVLSYLKYAWGRP